MDYIVYRNRCGALTIIKRFNTAESAMEYADLCRSEETAYGVPESARAKFRVCYNGVRSECVYEC